MALTAAAAALAIAAVFLFTSAQAEDSAPANPTPLGSGQTSALISGVFVGSLPREAVAQMESASGSELASPTVRVVAQARGFTLVTGLREDARADYCAAAFTRAGELAAMRCGPIATIASGFATVTIQTSDGSGQRGFSFLIVPDGFTSVEVGGQIAQVTNNVAAVDRPNVSVVLPTITFRRADGQVRAVSVEELTRGG